MVIRNLDTFPHLQGHPRDECGRERCSARLCSVSSDDVCCLCSNWKDAIKELGLALALISAKGSCREHILITGLKWFNGQQEYSST